MQRGTLLHTQPILSLLAGCQYTNRRAYNQGWLEGYQQADRWHHPAALK